MLEALLASSALIAATIDRHWHDLWSTRFADPLSEAETLILNSTGGISELGMAPDGYHRIQGQYMGLIKLRAKFASRLLTVYDRIESKYANDLDTFRNMYMTTFLQLLIDKGHPLQAVMVSRGWLEVDTARDLEIYESMSLESLSKLCEL